MVNNGPAHWTVDFGLIGFVDALPPTFLDDRRRRHCRGGGGAVDRVGAGGTGGTDRPPTRKSGPPRAAIVLSSRGCATTRATGTTTPRSPPTCSTPSCSPRRSPCIPKKSRSVTADSEELLSFPFVFMTGHTPMH